VAIHIPPIFFSYDRFPHDHRTAVPLHWGGENKLKRWKNDSDSSSHKYSSPKSESRALLQSG
jgi:hypothetical protein